MGLGWGCGWEKEKEMGAEVERGGLEGVTTAVV